MIVGVVIKPETRGVLGMMDREWEAVRCKCGDEGCRSGFVSPAITGAGLMSFELAEHIAALHNASLDTDKAGGESTGDELKDYRHACTEAREALAAIQRILGYDQDSLFKVHESDWSWIAGRRAEMSLDRINSATKKYQ